MKRLLVVMVMALTVTLAFSGCKNDDGQFTEPITLYEKVAGNWTLSELKQSDEFAKANGGKVTEADLTTQFGFDTFAITLTVDAANRPTTFAVSGTAPALLPTSGYWDLDREFVNWNGTPAVMRFWSDAARTQKLGSVELTGIPGASATMELKLSRKAKGIAFLSYTYKLLPANN